MALSEFKQGSFIYNEGTQISTLSLITGGEVEASFFGHKYRLKKADVIGLCDLVAGVHSCTYTALTDVTVYMYPNEGMSAVSELSRNNADMAYVMVNSMCRQVMQAVSHMKKLKQDAEAAHELVNRLYSEYENLCRMYSFTPKKLPGISELAQVPESGQEEDWLHEYYTELTEIDPKVHRMFFFGHPGITFGFLRRCASNYFALKNTCDDFFTYTTSISSLLLNKSSHDLLSLISDLHVNSVNLKGADESVKELVLPLTSLLSEMTCVDREFFNERLSLYDEALNTTKQSQEITDVPQNSGQPLNLRDSLNVILKYSGCPDELCNSFTRSLQEYIKLSDRRSADDDVYNLRKFLTPTFYEIYKQVFQKSVSDPAIPTIIKMFLNFGYVDPTLAGQSNAEYLYSIADSVNGDPENGIYTAYEWLCAIYKGKKEPCISEFEMDYIGYVREMKQAQKINAKEEARLLESTEEKFLFEMANVFPVVNRVTYGSPTVFVPMFADHNIVRNLEDTYVSADNVKKFIDEVRSVDFAAFFRETAYVNPKIGVPNEVVNVEVLPDIILMPNVGLRGTMWQEIEGRKRTTPARIFMPLFLENDLKPLVIRMTGEFRWEMCKRVQGSRWNDLSDPSLTSVFSDYLQFYMNNRKLSMQTMLSIRNEISTARNNYRTVFVANYTDWILHESRGSARLNSVAIGILMTYCAFSQPIREYLTTNLRYAEALNRYKVKQNKRVSYLTRLIQKVSQSGKAVPKELTDELEFAKR